MPTRSSRKREREETPPAPSSPEVEEEEEDEENGSEDSDAPANSLSASPIPAPPPMKKRRGRPPRGGFTSLPDTPQPQDDTSTAANTPAAATPRDSSPVSAAASPAGTHTPSVRGNRRGRRPWATGPSRGGSKRGGGSRASDAPTDKMGNVLNVIDDEIVVEEDPAGHTKVRKNGELLGGREYRCRTFTLLGRGERLYMLSTEPARCIGFRDSYLFFQKHKNLFKIIADEKEKFDLIDRNIIPHSYKGRAIGVLTARSVFREFGARIIVGGRRVNDDFEEKQAAEIWTAGELADPEDRLPLPGQEYNRNQYVAWHGASAVYHTSAPAVPEVKERSTGGLFAGDQKRKKKVALNDKNWMLEHAQAASHYNHLLADRRKEQTHKGLHEPHTNMKFYPAIFQPTAAKWEQVSRRLPAVNDDPDFEISRPSSPDHKANGTLVNGNASNGKPVMNGDHPKMYPRNVYMCVDTLLVTPMQNFGFTPGFEYDRDAADAAAKNNNGIWEDSEDESDDEYNDPGPDKGLAPGTIGWGDSGFGGGLKDVDPSIYSHLDGSIRKEILAQVEREKAWEGKWAGGEKVNGLRATRIRR